MSKRALIAGVCVLAISAAYATTPLNVKTGQWESTRITRIEGNTIPKSVLEQMPPARRAKIEKAMAARAAAKPMPKTSTSCLTEQERNDGGFGDTDTDCKKTVVSATATHWETKLTCNRDGTTQTGHMTLDAPSNDHVIGKMELTGKWLGANCPASADK